MKEISFKEALNLPNGAKFHVQVNNTNFHGFYKIGNHEVPYIDNISVVGVWEGSHKEAKVFKSNTKFYVGYDSRQVGEILVASLEKEIENIKDIYFRQSF